MKSSMLKFAGIAGLLLVAQVTSAEALYWKIDGTEDVFLDGTWEKKTSLFELSKKFTAANARVAYGEMSDGEFEQKGFLEILTFDDITGDYTKSESTPVVDYFSEYGIEEAVGPVWAELGDGMKDKFFQIQIYDGQSLKVMADVAEYSDLEPFISAGDYYGQWTDPWTGKYYVVPEPSSGLLVLLGSLLFGLKRKQEVI